jgi:hypothetical protein
MIAMLTCKVYIKDIDYNSVVDKLMPLIAQELLDKDNVFYTVLKNIISKNDKPTGITKLLVSIIPKKDDIVVSLLQQHAAEIILYTNEVLSKYMIIASIKTLKTRTIERNGGELIKLEITIDDIDYEQTIVNLIPLILKMLNKQNGIAGKTVSILTKNIELVANMVKAAIKELPENKRDELLAGILMEFSKEIIDTVNQTAEQNNIKAAITEIVIQN